MRKRGIIWFTAAAVLSSAVSCRSARQVCGSQGRLPDIFPDYAGVTIPPNIAPMNFCVLEPGRFRLVVSACSDSFSVNSSRDGAFNIPMRRWRKLAENNRGGELRFEVFRREGAGWSAYEPFTMTVARDEADPYIAYRLIPPGYVAWRQMGIYQRCIENFRQEEIISNSRTGGNCVNCHSFCMQDPGRMLFHSRAANAGTMMAVGGQVEKLNTKTPQTISALVYPSWHPSGRFVAFSTNDTHQAFFLNHPNRIEVYDEASDVVVYDVESHLIISCAALKSEAAFETFPTFSPDGRWLYFCSAEAVDSVRAHYRGVRYSLCRIAFNHQDGTFGEEVDTLFNARVDGRSASFPRVSPDGRFLIFTLHAFGCFSIWHHEADLWCIDLLSGGMRPLEEANSSDTESYHSWSHDGRWLVFSSRRIDGLYTRPYFTYIDSTGISRKPFLLPQKNPRRYYQSLRFSYNIPEFVTGRVDVNRRKLVDGMKHSEGINLTFEWR